MTIIETLHELSCGVCHMYHAIPDSLYRKAKDDGKSWHCPAGHTLVFTESEKHRLEKALAFEKECKESARRREDKALRQISAMKGVITKTKNRIANGVCPCCRRTFQNMRQHMKHMHPDYEKC